MDEVAIVSMARTAVGRFGGALRGEEPVELAAKVVRDVIARAGLEPEQVDRVVFGENIQMNRGGNPARRISIAAKLPDEVDAYTINMNCASGLRAIAAAAQDVMLGEADLIVAGGVETMSRTPYILEDARYGYRLGNGVLADFLADHILGDAGPMAEKVARTYGIGREEQDAFALESQRRAVAAIDAGRFAPDIMPVEVHERKERRVFDVDEHPRRDTSAESLARLRPVFQADGTVTAGNASGINDGAAAMVVTSLAEANRRGLRPLAVVRSWASAGVAPDMFGIGPVPATRKLLKKTGLSLGDMELVEINEAFASSTIAVMRDLELDPARVNVNGGAIALGHPVGATGVILVIKLVRELLRRGGHRGLVTMCIGSGQGMSMLLETA